MFIPLAIFFILGAICGSFINVLVWRTHSQQSIARGRSRCRHCHRQLAWFDLVPVFSFIYLRGRCRYCKKPISWQYPITELASGTVFGLLYWHFLPLDNTLAKFELIVWLIVSILIIAAAIYDYRWLVLPDRFMLPAIASGLFYIVILSTVFGQNELLPRLAASLIFGLVFFSLWYFSHGKWLGDGDIRIALLAGLLLNLKQLLVAIFFAFNLGAVVAIILLAAQVKKRRDPIALGPFLIAGLYIGLLATEVIIKRYFPFFT